MTQINEEPLTYLELYSKCKAFINISRKQPSPYLWPQASISIKCDRRDQTTLIRLSTERLKCLRFSHGAKTFPICTKCNDVEATPQHLFNCVDLVREPFEEAVTGLSTRFQLTVLLAFLWGQNGNSFQPTQEEHRINVN
ncbi:uncharacterized protein TNCV_4279001 [Trichonephila clavipes]|nr:uncharacterized protein TNCV_4279001 [Trichonephila clavipes]